MPLPYVLPYMVPMTAERLRQMLRDGLADIGCRNDDDIVRMASELWKPEDKEVLGHVFAGLILVLHGKHSVMPELIKLIRENWLDVSREKPASAFLSAIPAVLPLPVELRPPVGEAAKDWFLSAPILEWYEKNRESLHWNTAIGQFELTI